MRKVCPVSESGQHVFERLYEKGQRCFWCGIEKWRKSIVIAEPVEEDDLELRRWMAKQYTVEERSFLAQANKRAGPSATEGPGIFSEERKVWRL